MIKLRTWLFTQFFGAPARILELEREVSFLSAVNEQLRTDLAEKTREFKWFFDALLVEHGRLPMYLDASKEPAQTDVPLDKQARDPLDALKSVKSAREWVSVAAQVEAKAQALEASGLYVGRRA